MASSKDKEQHDLAQCIHLVGEIQTVREKSGHGEVIFTIADGVVVKATTMIRYQRKT
jgi:hypothetical protein